MLFSRLLLACLLAAPKTVFAAPSITLFLAGDVLPGRGVQKRLSLGQTTLQIFKSQIQSADFAFCNLEGAPQTPVTQQKPSFQVEDLKWLQSAGFDAVSLANNHALDAGEAGLRATQRQLKALKIGATGASWNQQFSPWRITIRGHQIAVVAATQWPPFGRGNARLQPLQTPVLCEQVRNLARNGVWPIVSLHWGVEGRREATAAQRKSAHALIDAGALVVVGHHSHLAGEVEWYRGRPIFYSLGNFLWDKRPTPQSGLAAQVSIFDEKSPRLKCRTWPVVPDAAPLIAKVSQSFPPLRGERLIQRLSGHFLRAQPQPQLAVWTRRKNGTHRLRLWQEKVEPGASKWHLVAEGQPFDLRKISVGDVDGDGCDELIAQLFQPSKLEAESRARLHVYGADGRRGWVPRWRGSHLSRPFLDWTLLPREGGTGCDLVARELNGQSGYQGVEWLTLYRWNGFGFAVEWEISVRGHIEKLRGGGDDHGPILSFARVREGKSEEFRLRRARDAEGNVVLQAVTASQKSALRQSH